MYNTKNWRIYGQDGLQLTDEDITRLGTSVKAVGGWPGDSVAFPHIHTSKHFCIFYLLSKRFAHMPRWPDKRKIKGREWRNRENLATRHISCWRFWYWPSQKNVLTTNWRGHGQTLTGTVSFLHGQKNATVTILIYRFLKYGFYFLFRCRVCVILANVEGVVVSLFLALAWLDIWNCSEMSLFIQASHSSWCSSWPSAGSR